MNARPKAILGYVVGWLLTVCFVVLFTVIFSFVGTLICAALAGMMMGAARLCWWQSLTLSMLFPGVISGYFRVTKAELPATQVLFLSALCFAIFWIIYLALWGLTSHERRGTAASKPAKAAGRPAAAAPAAEASALARAVLAPESAPADAVPAVTLAALQGKWLDGTAGPQSGNGHRRMEINDDTIVVSLVDDCGKVHSAKAHLRLCAHCVFGIYPDQATVCRAPQFESSIRAAQEM